MQKSENQNFSSNAAHHTVQKSTTLNRKYVKRPEPVAKKISIATDSAPRVIESTDLEAAILEAKEIEETMSPKITKFPVSVMAVEPETKKAANSLKIEVEDTKKVEVTEKSEKVKTTETADEAEEVEAAEEEIKIELAKEEAAVAEIEKAEVAEVKIENSEAEEVEAKATKITVAEEADLPPAPNPFQEALNARADALEVRKAAGRAAEFYLGLTAEERKNSEIEKAIAEVAKSTTAKPVSERQLKAKRAADKKVAKASARVAKASKTSKASKVSTKTAKSPKVKKVETSKSVLANNVSPEMSKSMKKGRGKRIALAFACSVACVTALGVFVYNSMPDISVKVTAMQSGIEAAYPSYVPRDFSLSSVYMNDENAVIMEFKGPDDAKFSITESESSWDSTALLNNYVKKKWNNEEYTAAREGGITIYIYNSSAVWVNGGMLYQIEAANGVLTKKQIKNIVTSM